MSRPSARCCRRPMSMRRRGTGTTALHWAVHLDNATLVDLLIKSGATVQVANRYKMTPLGLAAINGNAGVIGRLLKAGADANDTIAEGETALMTAARSDRVDVVKMLLAHGAKVECARDLPRADGPDVGGRSRERRRGQDAARGRRGRPRQGAHGRARGLQFGGRFPRCRLYWRTDGVAV